MKLQKNHGKRSKIIYRTISIYPLLKLFLYRVVAFAISIYCFYNFNENPLVTSIAGTLFLVAAMIIGDDELVVYSNKIKFSRNSLLCLLSKKGSYYFSDISSFNVTGEFGLTLDLISDNSKIKLLDPFNEIEITLRNGMVIKILNHIYIDKLKKASQIITLQIQRTQSGQF